MALRPVNYNKVYINNTWLHEQIQVGEVLTEVLGHQLSSKAVSLNLFTVATPLFKFKFFSDPYILYIFYILV